MRLSLYQGTYMNIKFAHKKTDPTTLSKVEKDFLMNKFKDDAYMLQEIQSRCGVLENSGKIKEKNDKEELARLTRQQGIYNKINQRYETPWHSVQDRSNEIALQCLRNAKKVEK